MIKKIIKFICIFLILIVVILLVEDSVNVNPKSIARNLISADKLNPDTISLRLKFLKIIPMGSAGLRNAGVEQYKGASAYHLVAEANSSQLFSKFFKAKARVDSYVDAKELYSLSYIQHLEISDRPDEDKEIYYDQGRNIMKIGEQERQLLPRTQDPLSAIFYIQKQEFKIGDSGTIYINTNQKNYDLNYKIISTEQITIKSKEFNIWLIKADVRRHDKSPRHSTSLKLWFLESQNTKAKVPILIKVLTNMGPITAYQN